MVEHLETLGFPEACVFSAWTARKGSTIRRKGARKGREVGEWVARWFKACPWQTMDCFGREATGWLGVWPTRHWRTGKQADRQSADCPACRRLAGQVRDRPQTEVDVTLPTDQSCGQVPRPVWACHLCRHADMQTAIRARRQTASIAVTPQGGSCAAPQHTDVGILKNMKAQGPCYNFQHMRFDVPATLCLNGAPDAGWISDAFTKASLGLGLPAVHRPP